MAGENYRVLVVDDEAEIREISCSTLPLKGHQAFQTGNGTKALEKDLEELRQKLT